MKSFIFVHIFQVHTKVTEELRGQLMQVQLYSKEKHLSQKKYIGFTVVKFVGDRYCEYFSIYFLLKGFFIVTLTHIIYGLIFFQWLLLRHKLLILQIFQNLYN